MSSFYEFVCYGCGGPLDTPLCYLCTCKQCGNILIDGTCLKCNSRAGNSFVYDPNPESFNEVQSIFNPPSQPHYNIYLCQICESNSHYGYECSQRIPPVYEPKLCYNPSFGDNTYPHDSPGVTPLIDHHCCYKCRDSLDGFFCHQCTCEFCGNDAHYGYNCSSHVPFTKTLPSVPQQYLCCEDCGVLMRLFNPEDSLRMRNEHFDTIPKTESDKFIKSSVENLVPSPRNLFEPFFDEEIISMKIDWHHFNTESDLIESLLNHDSSIISSSLKIYSLLDEFVGGLIILKSILPVNDETDCDPEEEIRLIKKLLDEIDLSLTLDDSMPPGIKEDDYESKRDMLIFEELLSNDSLSLPENESFHFDIPSSLRPPAKPPDDDEIEPNSRMLTIKLGVIFLNIIFL
nr:hypothetical protein [Tanacetum cinerariifolium]